MQPRGAELARAYYHDVVAPILDQTLPALPHAAGRLGSGSDVLGLDDETSRDHDWGLRLTLLVSSGAEDDVRGVLADHLPERYRGLPTRFATTWSPASVAQVEVCAPTTFVHSRLGVDASRELSISEWLSLTGQSVLEVIAGPIFHDGPGQISAIRSRLQWYPDDLWRYTIAVDWVRLAEELPFVGRSAERGDETGSRLLTAALVRTAMHLGFLLERRWAPYPKWFGTMFARLECAPAVGPLLEQALAATHWQEREATLGEALEVLADRQARVGLPAPTPVVVPFYDRPYRGLDDVAEQVWATITDPGVRSLPIGVGTTEQWSDNVKLLTDGRHRAHLTRVWAEGPTGEEAGYGPDSSGRLPPS